MKIMKYFKSIMAAAFCLVAFLGCDDADTGGEVDTPGTQATAGDTEIMEQAKDKQKFSITEDNVMKEDMTIAQIVEQSEQFSILQQALNSADLMQMFQSDKYTLLAPTNDAFEELNEGTLEEWLMSENSDFLTQVLQYHVIDGAVTAADLNDALVYTSILGSPLNFDVEEDGEININDHEVEYVIHASNGIIYVMGEVLMPDDIDDDLYDA